jgi:hypothetical protein
MKTEEQCIRPRTMATEFQADGTTCANVHGKKGHMGKMRDLERAWAERAGSSWYRDRCWTLLLLVTLILCSHGHIIHGWQQ